MEKTFVIAKYKEDVGWAKDLPAIVIDKGAKQIENAPGREAHTYLYFITENWGKLKGNYIFCQGHPFDHCLDFLTATKDLHDFIDYGKDGYESQGNGQPHHPDLKVHEYCKDLKLPIQKKYPFKPGGQFQVSTKRIYTKPFSFYYKAYKLTQEDPQSGYIFERLWKTIYDTRLER